MFVINIDYSKNLKYDIFLKKKFFVYSKCSHEYKKIFKDDGSIEILKTLDLINNRKEYQKIYNHAWRKHE